MRINTVSALPQVETPGWNAPPGEELATIYSDTYKLGLLALRLLTGDHDTTNPRHLPATTPALLRQVITDTLTKQPHQRPLPEAWNYVLTSAIKHAQLQPPTTTPDPKLLGTAPPSPPIPIVYSRPPYSVPPVGPSGPPPSGPPPSGPLPISPWPPPTTTAPTRSTTTNKPVAAIVVIAVIAVIVAIVALHAANNHTSTTATTSPFQGTSSYPSESSTAPTFSPRYTPTPTPTYTYTPPPPPPDSYVAIFSAQPDGWGWAVSNISAEDAKAKALAKCSGVNTGCHFNAVRKNGCVAIAKANDGTIWPGMGSSRAEAEQDALTHGGRSLAWACS
jgi:hypothetical protein